MPVLLAWWKPDDIASTDFFDWSAFELRPAKAGRDNQGLAERMGVPRGTGTRLEGDVTAAHTWRVANPEHRVYADGAGKQASGPLPEGRDPLRLISIVTLRSVMSVTSSRCAMTGPEPISQAIPSRDLRVSLWR